MHPQLTRRTSAVLLAGLTAATTALATTAPAAAASPSFNRVATFEVHENSDSGSETSAEIVDATDDGQTLVYSDSPLEVIGFIDISDPSAPAPGDTVDLAGEPTSVAVLGDNVLVGVNTSDDFVNVSGSLEVISIADRSTVASIDLGGQPDSVAVSPTGNYAAVAIENERDEDCCDDGNIETTPQLPAGNLVIIDTSDPDPTNWGTTTVDLTGLATIAPTDPEPEYVSINDDDLAVVTLQENNHLVLVDLATGTVTDHFSAGTSDLTGIDVVEDDVVTFDGSLDDVRREPDAVVWINATQFATANEGDLAGGSRGFTIWNTDGSEAFDSGTEMERLAARHGHYPEHRAENKGAEPEAVAVGTYAGTPYLLVNSERGNFVAVYDITDPSAPAFHQFLPTGVGPEGLLTIEGRDLFVVANEVDDAEEGIRATVMLYEFGAGESVHPYLISGDDADGNPIEWCALSALAVDSGDSDTLYTITDAARAETRILTIDTSMTPPTITAELPITKDGAPVGYDGEGIWHNEDGTFWIAQEGDDDPARENLIIRVDDDGSVLEEVELPDEVRAQLDNNGFEGITATGTGEDEQVYVAFQREWGDDPEGKVKIGRYVPATGDWAFFHYPLQTISHGGWIGLSEIVAVDDETFLVIERDNATGSVAETKDVTAFSIEGLEPTSYEDAAVTDGIVDLQDVLPTTIVEVLPVLQESNGFVWDKLEGLALAGDSTWIVTDNGCTDDATGETQLRDLGAVTVAGLEVAAAEFLPATGADARPAAMVALAMVVLGGTALLASRQRAPA